MANQAEPVFTDAVMAQMQAADPDRLVEAYLAVRQKRDQLKAAMELHSKRMERISDVLLQKMQELNITGFKSKCGYTVAQSELVSATITDKEQFEEYVRTSGHVELMEVRVSKGGVIEYLDTTKTLPPGVELNRVVRLSVRKSPAK